MRDLQIVHHPVDTRSNFIPSVSMEAAVMPDHIYKPHAFCMTSLLMHGVILQIFLLIL